MTNDEIRELAKEAGFRWGFIKEQGLMDGMIDFAKLIAQHEREACANACEQIALGFTNWPESFEGVTAETKLMRSLGEFVHKPFTEAIRARGQA